MYCFHFQTNKQIPSLMANHYSQQHWSLHGEGSLVINPQGEENIGEERAENNDQQTAAQFRTME